MGRGPATSLVRSETESQLRLVGVVNLDRLWPGPEWKGHASKVYSILSWAGGNYSPKLTLPFHRNDVSFTTSARCRYLVWHCAVEDNVTRPCPWRFHARVAQLRIHATGEAPRLHDEIESCTDISIVYKLPPVACPTIHALISAEIPDHNVWLEGLLDGMTAQIEHEMHANQIRAVPVVHNGLMRAPATLGRAPAEPAACSSWLPPTATAVEHVAKDPFPAGLWRRAECPRRMEEHLEKSRVYS